MRQDLKFTSLYKEYEQITSILCERIIYYLLLALGSACHSYFTERLIEPGS
jgi:hypothetical protein